MILSSLCFDLKRGLMIVLFYVGFDFSCEARSIPHLARKHVHQRKWTNICLLTLAFSIEINVGSIFRSFSAASFCEIIVSQKETSRPKPTLPCSLWSWSTVILSHFFHQDILFHQALFHTEYSSSIYCAMSGPLVAPHRALAFCLVVQVIARSTRGECHQSSKIYHVSYPSSPAGLSE